MTNMQKLTRKQALERAIEILSIDLGKSEDRQEVVDMLKLIANELPLVYWTEEVVFDAFDQFIIENGRAPFAKEVTKEKHLPSSTTIRKLFNMEIGAFIKKYYSEYQKEINRGCCNPKYIDKDYWINYFKQHYNVVLDKVIKATIDNNRRSLDCNIPWHIKNAENTKKVLTQKEYDDFREENTPCAQVIMQMAGASSWIPLLKMCGIRTNRHMSKEDFNIITVHPEPSKEGAELAKKLYIDVLASLQERGIYVKS